MPQYYYDDQNRQYLAPEPTVPISEAKSDFTRWLFSFREQVVDPLKHIWRGEEFTDGAWQPNPDEKPLMNEKGVRWCISLIDSYLNISTIVTNLDDDAINFRMRHVCRDIWNGLCYQYATFDIDKVNIPRIANEIEAKIHFILLGAKENGYRTFFTKTYQVSEIRQTGSNEQHKGSFWNKLNLFGKSQQEQLF